MKKPSRKISIASILFILISALVGFIFDKYNDDHAYGSIKTFEGKVTKIYNLEGACLTYELDNNKYEITAECPDITDIAVAFVGNYDKNIVVGDTVTVRAGFQAKSGNTKYYSLESPSTYIRLK